MEVDIDEARDILQENGESPDYIITFDDEDDLLHSLSGLTEKNLALAEEISYEGSKNTFINARQNNDFEALNILEENGIYLTLADEILHQIENAEYGDIFFMRLYRFLAIFAKLAKVKGKVNVPEEYLDYRAFDTFDFTLEYSGYELELWLGSLFDLIENIPEGLSLYIRIKPQYSLYDG